MHVVKGDVVKKADCGIIRAGVCVRNVEHSFTLSEVVKRRGANGERSSFIVKVDDGV